MSIHLKIALQIERGYYEKTGQWGDNEYLIDRINGDTVITFRGTETVQLSPIDLNASNAAQFMEKLKSFFCDVTTDIRAIPWYDHRIGWGHAGFLKAARGIVDHELVQIDLRGERIRVAGHSLGGAIAREAAQFLLAEGLDVIECIDFGAPRSHIGQPKYQLLTTSYRYGQDFVTTVPWGAVWKYKHPYEVGVGILEQLGPKYNPKAPHSWGDHNISECYIPALDNF